MGYFNGNKVFAVVKTQKLTNLYKHSVKMQGTYNNMAITIYAELYTTASGNYSTNNLYWDDCMDEWNGIIAGDIDGQNVQYLSCGGSSLQFQTEVYEDMNDIGTSTFITIDMSVMEFISDTVTPVLL